jgi:ABC-type sugar transport system substrate-binding protein
MKLERLSCRGRLLPRLSAASAVLALAIGLSACGGSSSSGTTSSSSSAASTSAGGSVAGKTVYFLGCGAETPYCAKQNAIIETQLKAAGIKPVVQTDGEYNATIQAQQLTNAVAQHPALIVGVFGAQTALRLGFLKAKQAKIPILSASEPIAPGMEGLVDGAVVYNDQEVGQQIARQMQEALQKLSISKGRVLFLAGVQGEQAAEGYRKGFLAEMGKAPQFPVTIDYANWLPTKAATDTQQELAKYHEIVGIAGANGSEAAAAVSSAEQAGRKPGKDLAVVAGNCTAPAQKDVKAGTIYGDSAASPITDSETQVKVIIEALKTGKIPAFTGTPFPAVTAANVSQYERVCNY